MKKDAIESAQRVPPNLILVSVAGLPHEVVTAARHIRELAASERMCRSWSSALQRSMRVMKSRSEKRVYHPPDNFNQLRTLLARLLNEIPIAA
jgi:hypothetical protein